MDKIYAIKWPINYFLLEKQFLIRRLPRNEKEKIYICTVFTQEVFGGSLDRLYLR